MGKKKVFAIPRHYENVGIILRQMRLNAGLTQRAVALRLDYSSAQFISNFERGIAVPTLRKLKLMVEIYGVPVEAIVAPIVEAERMRLMHDLQKEDKDGKLKKPAGPRAS